MKNNFLLADMDEETKTQGGRPGTSGDDGGKKGPTTVNS